MGTMTTWKKVIYIIASCMDEIVCLEMRRIMRWSKVRDGVTDWMVKFREENRGGG
jgi:hypothetical protein